MFLILFALGCGASKTTELTIDGSSEAAFDASLDKIEKSLDAEKAKQFEEALLAVVASDTLSGKPLEETRKSLNGLSADDVIKKGTEAKKANKKRADDMFK